MLAMILTGTLMALSSSGRGSPALARRTRVRIPSGLLAARIIIGRFCEHLLCVVLGEVCEVMFRKVWPCGPVVTTPDSQSGNEGSIPSRVIRLV